MPTAAATAPAQIRAAVLLVNFQDDQRQPWTTGYISQLLNGPPAGTDGRDVAEFFTAGSWGQTILTADVFGWYVTNTLLSVDGCNIGLLASQANTAATDAGVNLAAYTNLIYVFPHTNVCGFSGTADDPGTRSWQNLDPAVCTDIATCQHWDSETFVHELSHNFGIDHASSYVCDAGVLAGTCTQSEYGDGFDVMGCCSSYLWSNLHRLQLGWIPPAQLVTITQSGQYVITPANASSSAIDRVCDGSGFCLYFENRAAAEQGYVARPAGNLLVRRYPQDWTQLNPNTQLLDGDADGGVDQAWNLATGASFQWGNITITDSAWDGTNNTVTISGLPPPPPLAQCQDGIDNDLDGRIDYPADHQCTSPTDNDEKRR